MKLFAVVLGLLSLFLRCQSEPLFYIYDWPDHFQDVWPPMNYSLSPKSPYSHHFRGNNGAGTLVDADLGYFSTWQFSMYQITMARLRASKFRTLDPALAKTFIVPYDFGTHSFIDHKDGHERVASPHGWSVIQRMKKDIANNKYLWRNTLQIEWQ